MPLLVVIGLGKSISLFTHYEFVEAATYCHNRSYM